MLRAMRWFFLLPLILGAALIAIGSLPMPGAQTGASGGRKALRVGEWGELPAVSRPYACREWSDVERIERDAGALGGEAAAATMRKALAKGGCIRIEGGQRVFITNLSLTAIQFASSASAETRYWTPKAVAK